MLYSIETKEEGQKKFFQSLQVFFCKPLWKCKLLRNSIYGNKLSRTSNQSNETYLKFDISMMKEIRSKQMSLTYFGSSSFFFFCLTGKVEKSDCRTRFSQNSASTWLSWGVDQKIESRRKQETLSFFIWNPTRSVNISHKLRVLRNLRC